MKRPNNQNGITLAGVHTHGVSGYLAYKKIDIENIKAHMHRIYVSFWHVKSNINENYLFLTGRLARNCNSEAITISKLAPILRGTA